MNAVAYTRVSTNEQADSGLSMDSQARRIAAYCEAQDWTLVETVRDEGQSAGSLKRPGITHVLDLVRRGAVDVIVVLKLDRLTRSVKDLGELLDLFTRNHVAFTSVSDNFDTTTANGRLVLHILGSVAQWERDIIGERTKTAMEEAKRQGRLVGAVPFGFTLDGDRLLPQAAALETVRRMVELREDGATLRGIAGHLNEVGAVTARGCKWTAEQVRRVLRNGIYTPHVVGFTPEGGQAA